MFLEIHILSVIVPLKVYRSSLLWCRLLGSTTMVKRDCKDFQNLHLYVFEFAYFRRCQLYNWPFYAFLVAPLAIVYTCNWLFYVSTLVFMTRKGIVAKSSETQHSLFYHVFAAMLLSLLYGIGWAFGFIASSNDVSRDAYLATQYLFSFFILAHTVLQFIFYLPPREELARLWHVVTCRAKDYEVEDDPVRGSRSNDYVAVKGLEAIGMDESVLYSEKQPLDDGEKGSGVAKGAANRLADDPEAITSYTNKKAMEGSDNEEDKPISSL